MPRKKSPDAIPAVPESTSGDSVLNKISVPISPLRWKLAELQKEGKNEYPLGDLLFLIRDIVRTMKEE